MCSFVHIVSIHVIPFPKKCNLNEKEKRSSKIDKNTVELIHFKWMIFHELSTFSSYYQKERVQVEQQRKKMAMLHIGTFIYILIKSLLIH